MVNVSDFLREFADQAKNPPGQDPCIGACHQAIFNLALQDNQAIRFIFEILRDRAFTPKHFANLFFDSLQYIELYLRPNQDYPHLFRQVEPWTREIRSLLQQERQLLRNMLLMRHEVTTCYQAYVGPKAILTAFFAQQQLRVADFGCGANYGLRGLAQAKPFKPILDHTPGRWITRLLAQPLYLEEIWAIDKEDPHDPMAQTWQLACSFYPKDLHQINGTLACAEKLAKKDQGRFIKADLLQLAIGHKERALPPLYFDAIIISRLFYQLQPTERDIVLQKAQAALKPTGVIIIQDQARKDEHDSRSLNYAADWFSPIFTHRTFVTGPRTQWQMKEILDWTDEYYREVRGGEDFGAISRRQEKYKPDLYPCLSL